MKYPVLVLRISVLWSVFTIAANLTGSEKSGLIILADMGNEPDEEQRIRFTVPFEAAGKEIHIILEVHDLNDIVNLYDYRRLVIS